MFCIAGIIKQDGQGEDYEIDTDSGGYPDTGGPPKVKECGRAPIHDPGRLHSSQKV